MTSTSALVTTIHQVLALHRIDLSGISQAVRIPLATVQRVTTPTTAPIALTAWEALLRVVGASVVVEFQGERYPVALPSLEKKRVHEAHERLVERTYAASTITPLHRLQGKKEAMTREQARRQVSAQARQIARILKESLPTGRQHSPNIFAPAVAVITGVATAGVLGRSFEGLELVTGIPARTHRKLCAPDDQRPVAILQTVLALVGMVVVVEHNTTRWVIGSPSASGKTFVKTMNQATGATRGAPAHEHLPLAPSQLLGLLVGEHALVQDIAEVAQRAGVVSSTLKHWERRRRDPTLEALEAMTAALGGHVILRGRIERRIIPSGPTPERLAQAFKQTCSAYRWSVGRATELTGGALMTEIRRRVEHTRVRVQEHLRLLPATEKSGIVAWIRARRAVLQTHGLGSVLELSLITGLNRRIIDRILLDADPLDGPYLRALTFLGISLTVTTSDSLPPSADRERERPGT